tara:strand:+ start:411 stop:989 length:579 start_codon:yes stop_codon:yes gene_type:complete
MKILVLSPYPESITPAIEKEGDSHMTYDDLIDLEFIKKNNIEFIISYGYKFLIGKDVIEYLKSSIINLHISYLPFNRGYYPNLWSHIEHTPSGISIHRINNGIDKGEILIRSKVFIDSNKHTLKSSYLLLRAKIESLFKNNWRKLRKNELIGFEPLEKGTFHLKKEGEKILCELNKGWDTKISQLNNLKESI